MFFFKLQNQSRVKGNSIFLVLGALPAPSPPHLGKQSHRFTICFVGRTPQLSKLSWEGILRAFLDLRSGFCGLGGGYHDHRKWKLYDFISYSFGVFTVPGNNTDKIETCFQVSFYGHESSSRKKTMQSMA